MKIGIKYKKNDEKIKKFMDKYKEKGVRFKVERVKEIVTKVDGSQEEKNKGERLVIRFINKDILDTTEIDMYNIVKKTFKKFEIIRFSKKFYDLHKVSKGKKFIRALKMIEKNIKPLYVKQGDKYWWIGIENHKESVDIAEVTKEIYSLGLSLSLIPADFCKE